MAKRKRGMRARPLSLMEPSEVSRERGSRPTLEWTSERDGREKNRNKRGGGGAQRVRQVGDQNTESRDEKGVHLG